MARDNGSYTRSDAIEYVKYLGCWTSIHNKKVAILNRNDEEYAQDLRQLIKANKQRSDPPGRWETWAAEQALETMGDLL